MKLNFSLQKVENYLFLFAVFMFLVSFLTLEIDISIIDVISIVLYLLGRAKLFPGFFNSILKFVGLIVSVILGIIVVVIVILLLYILI